MSFYQRNLTGGVTSQLIDCQVFNNSLTSTNRFANFFRQISNFEYYPLQITTFIHPSNLDLIP